ncbi:MAG: peptidylprolyl isomerase [bacterium]
MRRLLRRPAFHFLVSGALLFAGSRWASERWLVPPRAGIEIAAGRVDALRASWLARTGEAPEGAALEALVSAEIDDEILLAEARARGLETSDPVVRARLARGVGFLAAGDERTERAGNARRVEDALASGLARGDLVVRRRLIERMRAELSQRDEAAVGDAEIAARFAREPERFASPARIRLSHVFLSGDRHGAALAADAAHLRARISAEALDPAHAIPLGDSFVEGHVLPPRSEADLAREFGGNFAHASFALEPGTWSAPIASSYGLHLVFVHERTAGAPVSLDSARAQIRNELTAEHAAAALRRSLDALRARYDVRVAGAGT